jgi:hypothetical protein
MPIYTCPECGKKLKKNDPLAPGKKLKCSGCEAIFAPVPAKEQKAAPAPAPARPKSKFDDDDGPANYGLAQDTDTKESEEERNKAFGPIRERFEKSKKGPAIQMVVKPANFLLLWGVIACIMGVSTGLVATWDMIFKREVVEEKGKKSLYETGQQKTKFKELSTDEFRERLLWLAGGVAYFAWGAAVCAGASRMHEVQTYWLAMVGSVMGIICPVLPLAILLTMWAYEDPANAPDMAWMGPAVIAFLAGIPITAWCVMTLLNQKVKDGFADETDFT